MGVLVAVSSALVAAVVLSPSVEAHGWIEKPLARQFCNGNTLKWQVSISGGNGARGLDPPYGGKPGLCGDPFEGYDHNPVSNFEGRPCEPQEVYQQGGIMSMQIDIAANHGGFWEVSICDSTEISQECFDRNKLKTVSHDAEQWWIMDRKLDSPTDQRPDSYFMDWKLPPGLVCDHCVVQWSWWTAHNCIYECDAAVCGSYADRKNPIVYPGASWKMKYCESKYPVKGQQPQMFVNCADIKIEGSGAPVVAPTPVETTTVDTTTVDTTTVDTTTVDTTTVDSTTVDTTTPDNTTFDNSTTPALDNTFTEQSECVTMSRRFLLGEEVLEEEDGIEDISGAGNGMNCGNIMVDEVLIEINHMRKEARVQPLECSNRAVGVAANFANIMADMGMELDDASDNCNLAGFGGRCVQMVATGATGAPLTTLSGIDYAALVAPEYAVAGVGYHDVNGVTYWTILMG